jgi:D-glycero-D-manno-heptose 1,7-bisphosphate phosphatase
MKELDISLTESVMVGDRCSDIAAANSAGLRQAFLLEGTENSGCSGSYLFVKSLAEIERWLMTHDE